MTASELELVRDQLISSEARLLALTANLSPKQWHFREAPDRWSIAENMEHLIVFESFINAAIANAMQQSAAPEKRAHAAAQQQRVLGLADSTSSKFVSREINRPTGRWPHNQLNAELHAARAGTLAFLAAAPPGLSDHFFPHIAFGDLDCGQWLLALGRHAHRHAAQIEAIKAHPEYPSS